MKYKARLWDFNKYFEYAFVSIRKKYVDENEAVSKTVMANDCNLF